MSMGGNIGSASITIEADAKGFASDVEKQTEGPMAKTGTGLGNLLSDTMGAAFSTGAKVIGTSVATVLAAALSSGFKRLNAIDTATTKLAALGNTTAEVESIMQSASAAVKGTAFGLDEAATAAAGMTAAGVDLEDIGPALQNMANMATVSGGSMASLDDVFRDMASSSAITLTQLDRLGAQGIPALQLLAEAYGVTADEASAMVRQGEIDFNEFNAIMNESLGEAAKSAGDSFTGSMKNVLAALSRLGAVLLGPAFQGLKSIFKPLIGAIDEVTAALTPLMQQVAGPVSAAFERMGEALGRVDFSGMSEGIGNFAAALAPLIPLLAAFIGPLLSKIPLIGGAFAGLTAPVSGMIGLFITLFALNPATLAKGFDALGQMIPSIIQTITSALLGFITTVLPQMAAALIANVTVIVQGLLSLVITIIPVIAQALAALLPALISTLVSMIPGLFAAALQLFMSIVEAIPIILPILLEGILAILGPLLATILSMAPSVVAAAIDLFFGLVTGVITNLPAILEAIIGLLPDILTAIVSLIPAVLSAAIELFFAIVQGVLENIEPIVAAIVGMIPQLVAAIVGAIPQILAAAVQLFAAIIQGIIQNIGPIVSTIVGQVIPAAVQAVVGSVGQMVSAGIDLMRGLAQGIRNGIGAVMDAISSVASQAVSAAKSALKIGSPSKVFAGIGKDTMLGYEVGVKGMASRVQHALEDSMPSAAGTAMLGGAGMPVVSGGIGGFGSGTGGTSTTSNTGAVFNEGAIQVVEADNSAATAIGVVDRIAERVAL